MSTFQSVNVIRKRGVTDMILHDTHFLSIPWAVLTTVKVVRTQLVSFDGLATNLPKFNSSCKREL
jgi:hypothetical protein